MRTIQIQIEDETVKRIGKNALIARFQNFLELEDLQASAKKIIAAVEAVGLDNNDLLEQARQDAWNEFKSQKLKDLK